jgi:hypothetical protein
VEFSATSGGSTVSPGGEITAGAPVTFHVRTNMPADMTAVIRNGPATLRRSPDAEFSVEAPGNPGAYWLAVVSARPETLGITWVRTNPIYIRAENAAPPQPGPTTQMPAGDPGVALFDGTTSSGWRIERDAGSEAALDVAALVDAPALRLRYGLAAGMSPPPFVALAYDLPDGVAESDSVAFNIRSEQPMRMSVQVRAPAGADDPGERWQDSVYVDAAPRDYTVALRGLSPVGATNTPLPRFSEVRSLLLVIDSVNTRPGTSGRVWISRPTLHRQGGPAS